MSDETEKFCEGCSTKLKRVINWNGAILIGTQPSRADHKEKEHRKKVKDPERAAKMRKKAFGQESVGSPPDKADSRHVIKKGRVLAGQQKEVNKEELTKALAKDDYAVKIAKEAIKQKK